MDTRVAVSTANPSCDHLRALLSDYVYTERTRDGAPVQFDAD